MTTEIVLDHEYRNQLRELTQEQFKTRTLSSEIANEGVAYAIACIGAELGLSPLQSLRGIYMVKGKPILGAQTIHAIVVRRRDVCEYLMLVESTREKATYETKRVGDPKPTQLSYTLEDAKAAGLLGNAVWKHAAAMLRNRCIAALCRAVYPDLALGLYEESEGEEIRASEPRVVSSTGSPEPLAHEERRFEALPETPETPHPAFAPTEEDKRAKEYLEKIQAAQTLADLQQIAIPLKEESNDLKYVIRPIYGQRDLELRAKLPNADLAALWKKAQELKEIFTGEQIESLQKTLGQ